MPNIAFAGFVYNNAGTAIVGATVEVFDRNTTTPVRATTTTDATGYYTISHATEGRFDVRATSGSSVRFNKYDTALQLTTLEVANFRVRNPAFTFEYDIVPAAITADRQLNLPLITATDTLAALALAQTFLTGVKTFNSSILAIRNPGDTFSYTIVASAITADRSLTLPLITGTDTLVTLGLAQTVTGALTLSSILTVNANIQFPASQVASAGANVLDDYEEGSWTPGVSFGNGTTGITYSSQAGLYTKIGNKVVVTGIIILTNKGTSTGTARITGLPFTILNAAGGNAAPSLYVNVITYTGILIAYAELNTTNCVISQSTEAGSTTDLADTNFANTSLIRIQLSYET